ncbi:phytoene desaturase family protein [Nocardioides piscis]|uniref:FAD-dependent oxidoreductase n=1 Tax=Nocardioides piscis TaxID=2714938 RepID=A0A6G7YJD3_9ACTN|nr:FAD-dependent oxidoreductase [Nocardioides piscis]QIK76845.1 FAD-dependent oxidoreductase [Nocardioides piscis]
MTPEARPGAGSKRIVVVGGGFGGMASALRLAKLGHEVTLLEGSAALGGALAPISADGFTWDSGAATTLLPAVLRDLFRKTGRPLEREVDLIPLDVIREHRFEDRSVLRLPGGSRAAQLDAFDQLGGFGSSWSAYVDAHAETWEVLRRGYLEQAWDPALAPRGLTDLLTSREMLHKLLRGVFKDERLRLVASHPFVIDGHDLRNVPAWMGVTSYLEQTFGAWTIDGGLSALEAVLTERLTTRGVTVVRETTALDVVVREGRAAAVRTQLGEIDADAVVCAIDPRRLPVLASFVRRTMPAIPPVISHVGLEGDVPDLPHEVVLHGDPMLVIRRGGQAPPGCTAWTVVGRGKLAEDVLRALARHKIDVRSQVVSRIDRTPRDLVDAWGGSPLGVLWQGRQTVRDRLGPTTPVPGVYAAGAHATPGAGLPFVGLSAALVAAEIGAA